jgi:hypothetical protein
MMDRERGTMRAHRRSKLDPPNRIREAIELIAPTMHREEGLEAHDRAVRIFVVGSPTAKRTTSNRPRRPAGKKATSR